jgi:hypothetical protein
MKNNKIIYSLNENDIQTTAQQELGRELTRDEMKTIVDLFPEKINWYDAIADSINEKIKTEIQVKN